MIRRSLVLSLFVFAVACATDPADDDKGRSDVGSSGDVGADASGNGGNDASTQDMGNGGEDLAMPDCADGEVRDVPCGLNGRGTEQETCTAAMWAPGASCDDPDVCTDDEEQDSPCGRNNRGALPQICTTGAWQDDGVCTDPDICTDVETRTVACGLNGRGTQEQTCVAGAWDESAVCTDPDPCTDGTMRDISCGLNDRGTLSQTCVAGDWQDDAACVDPDSCTDGGTQAVTCGLNDRGMQQQSCASGAWVNVGGCTGADVCTDGAMQNVSCGLNNNGSKDQTCVTGMWADQGACNDPDVCINNTTQQIMCGFDGTQDQTCAAGSWVDVGGCLESIVSYCATRPASVQTIAGQPSPTIEGLVFVDAKTPGAGMSAGVIGELAWGPTGTAVSTWTDVAQATYSGDEDGLTAGDLANDVWAATITSAVDGDFDYAFRFSADNGATWQNCDTTGTVDGAFDSGALGALTVDPPNLADDCEVRFPQLTEQVVVGTPITFYGRVTEVGIAGMGSANADIVGELLVGPVGTDPRPDATGFQAVAATYNTVALNLAADQDEYEATFVPMTAGDFAFGYRFSVNGGANWEFCGLRDVSVATPDFEPAKMGWMNVEAVAGDLVDFCHVWETTMSDDAATGTLPTVTMEVFEAGTTDSPGNSADLEVEAAWFALESNPAIVAATWTPLSYKGLRPGVPNNYEYDGTPYTAGNHPPAGAYNIAVRVRETGSTNWLYCDTDESAPEFRLEAASRLTVTP